MTDQDIEEAFLGVMNANDRELALPLTDWAGRNLLKRRIAVALRTHLARQWQGMERAPRDGTSFLLYGKSWDTDQHYGGPDEAIGMAVCNWPAHRNYPSVTDSVYYEKWCVEPLAWMPLPTAPFPA